MKVGFPLLGLGVILFLLNTSGTIPGPPSDTVYMLAIVSFVAGIALFVISQFKRR
jgi:hypothetical protein